MDREGKEGTHILQHGADGPQSIYETLDYVLAFFNFCTGLVASGLNVFVIYALLISRRGMTAIHGSDMYVIGLTISELMTGLALVTSIGVVFVDPQQFFCISQICFFQSTILCSALFVTLMTSDRYFKIVFPYVYQRVCSVDLYPLLITCAVYLSAFLIGSMPLMGVGLSPHMNATDWKLCSYLQITESYYRVPYLVMMFVPIMTAVSFYTKIFLVARSHIQSIAKTQLGHSKVPRGRYMRMIFIMVGLYFVFYIPPAMFSLLHDFSEVLGSGNPVREKTIFHISSLGLLCNTIVDPIIYAYTLPSVKNMFRNVLGLPVDSASQHGTRSNVSSFHRDQHDKRMHQHSLLKDEDSRRETMKHRKSLVAPEKSSQHRQHQHHDHDHDHHDHHHHTKKKKKKKKSTSAAVEPKTSNTDQNLHSPSRRNSSREREKSERRGSSVSHRNHQGHMKRSRKHTSTVNPAASGLSAAGAGILREMSPSIRSNLRPSSPLQCPEIMSPSGKSREKNSSVYSERNAFEIHPALDEVMEDTYESPVPRDKPPGGVAEVVLRTGELDDKEDEGGVSEMKCSGGGGGGGAGEDPLRPGQLAAGSSSAHDNLSASSHVRFALDDTYSTTTTMSSIAAEQP